MSTPTPAAVVEAIKDWGVEFRPWGSDWSQQTTAGGWAPIGIGHHHTAGTGVLSHDGSGGLGSAQRSMLDLLRKGRSDLDGPLCNFAPTYVGKNRRVVYGIGRGNVNHAGYIGARVAGLLREGRFTGVPALGRGAENVDGNSILWGLEYLHPGDSTPWPTELLDTGHRVAAAICEASGWDPLRWAGSNAEHRELTGRKVDRSWVGWGDGMRKAITQLAADNEPVEPVWKMSPKIEEAVKLLANARDRKLAAGRKAQAHAIDQHIKAIRADFRG